MSKKLVCYFSASGITRDVAEKIAGVGGFDIFEIEPKQKYTPSDLDWRNQNSRTSIEMRDNSSRPEIINRIGNLKDYDTIILGFPVWWYKAPMIINTFIEENDLKGKKIYIFVTSGSSSYASSFNDLVSTYPELNFVSGIRFTPEIDNEDINKWLN